MSEERWNRIEEKVDDVKTEVSELKTDLKVHVAKVEHKMDIFDEHITGDNKIINHLEPLLSEIPKITEMLEEYKVDKVIKQRRSDKLKYWTGRLGIISLVLGIIFGFIRTFLV